MGQLNHLIALALETVRAAWGWLCSVCRRFLGSLREFLHGKPQPVAPAVTPAASAAASAIKPDQPTQSASPSPAPQTAAREDDAGEETALARILAAEASSVPAKTTIGWLAIQQARSRKLTVQELLARGLGTGPQDRRAQGFASVEASATQRLSETDRTLARLLLSGGLAPSFAIQQHKPGRWAQRGAGLSDEKLLEKQNGWHEGIYGRISGTQWYVFSQDASKLVTKPGQTAKQVLDAVGEVPGLD